MTLRKRLVRVMRDCCDLRAQGYKYEEDFRPSFTKVSCVRRTKDKDCVSILLEELWSRPISGCFDTPGQASLRQLASTRVPHFTEILNARWHVVLLASTFVCDVR